MPGGYPHLYINNHIFINLKVFYEILPALCHKATGIWPSVTSLLVKE